MFIMPNYYYYYLFKKYCFGLERDIKFKKEIFTYSKNWWKNTEVYSYIYNQLQKPQDIDVASMEQIQSF